MAGALAVVGAFTPSVADAQQCATDMRALNQAMDQFYAAFDANVR